MSEKVSKNFFNDPVLKLILSIFTITSILSLSKILGFLALSWSWILYPPFIIIGFIFYVGIHAALLNIFKEKIKEEIKENIIEALEDNTTQTITSINLALRKANDDD